MSRVLRPQMPGIAFHITARTQGKEPWFEKDLRDEIKGIILEGIASSDALLLSHVVMPNHYHVVLRQGSRSLGWTIQPIQRRIALLIQRARRMKGHVFERRFRSHACESADHLRRAIVYTNLNPQRAGLCAEPGAWGWSSHVELLLDQDVGPSGLQIVQTLKLFGDRADDTLADLRAAYLRYVAWRLEKDAHDAADLPYHIAEPWCRAGDRHFSELFCSLPPLNREPQHDLRDRAIELLKLIAADCDIVCLKRRTLPRVQRGIRHELIAALLQAGYQGKNIASFLRISESAVSAVAGRVRYGELDRIVKRGPAPTRARPETECSTPTPSHPPPPP